MRKGEIKMRHELHFEQLTVLPKRFETRGWGRGGGNYNFVALNQQNFSIQESGWSWYGSEQVNIQTNVAEISQR
jgi:hypothetical protein